MPKAVSNAGPLIALASIGQFGLLQSLFGEVLIPPTVRAEILAGGEGEAGVSDLAAADWVKTITVKDDLAVQLLRDELGAGESEAIVLAKEVSADWTLLDDLAARRKAQTAGLRVVGTLGILLMAKSSDHIPTVKPLVDRLRQGDFRMSTELYEHILQQAGETA
ncbi:MAG TPA: DUF3368 domain-containing protein [Anaerolineae bacterium]|nr:DUF3368 domain-containing protein [Anaerolineae bacterium]